MKLQLSALTAHADPLTQASNTIALVLISNTPFYPLYLYFILGRAGLPWLWLSAASLPFLVITLFIARRNGLRARIWLSATATINSVYVTWLLGEASGTALFLIPCISLAVLSFRRREIVPMGVLTALPFALFIAFHGRFPAPPALYPAAAYGSLLRLNELSVASITAVLGYVFGKANDQVVPRSEKQQVHRSADGPGTA